MAHRTQENSFLTVVELSVCVLGHDCLSVPPQTLACQAPLSLVFPRQEYWSGLLFPPPGDLPSLQ